MKNLGLFCLVLESKLMKYIFNFLSFTILALLASCSQPVEPEKPKGVVRISTVPFDMPILINGVAKGNSSSQGGQLFSISLEEGEYKIELLKPINDEKDLHAIKSVLVAGDTLQTITLEAEERLTEFGEQEKIRLEKEAMKAAEEKARLVAIEKERQKKAAQERAKRESLFQEKMTLANRQHADIINAMTVETAHEDAFNYTYEVIGCKLTLTKIFSESEQRNYHLDLRYLNKTASITSDVKKYWHTTPWGNRRSRDGIEYSLVCENEKECINYNFNGEGYRSSSESYIEALGTDTVSADIAVQTLDKIIENCQK